MDRSSDDSHTGVILPSLVAVTDHYGGKICVAVVVVVIVIVVVVVLAFAAVVDVAFMLHDYA